MKDIINIREIKKICLNGLRAIDEFCKENNIQYYLAYGTLLGAVRHNGFIPWDDDIDIWMPREDYDKFCSLLVDQIPDWKLLTCKNERRYLFEWAKLANLSTVIWPSRFRNGYVYGVSIDIFPLETIDALNEIEANKLLKKCVDTMTEFRSTSRTISGGLDSRKNKFVWMKMQIGYWLSALKYGNANARLKKTLSKMPVFSEGEYYACYLTPVPCVFKKALFENIIEHQFENESFIIPSEYDSILSTIYGDYMTPPPIEKRVTHHSFVAYKK